MLKYAIFMRIFSIITYLCSIKMLLLCLLYKKNISTFLQILGGSPLRFKRIFGTEFNSSDCRKDLLINFLNSVIPQLNIKDLTYKKTENLGNNELDKKVIFDLYCENEKGQKFIVELQKANGATSRQAYFKDRTLFYSTGRHLAFPIQEQGQKGDWNYELKAVYTIAILDFIFDDKKDIKFHVKLMDTIQKEIFYDKLTFVYLQTPNFEKNENELATDEDKWYFVFKNLHKLDKIPSALKDEVFEKLFKNAEIAKFSPAERTAYQDSLKYYRDVKNSLDTAKQEGRVEGEAIGIDKGKQEKSIEIAQNAIKKGFDNETIAELTGLTIEQIEELRKRYKN
jgi:predicted transposase/invertase (TIGR01784 family)